MANKSRLDQNLNFIDSNPSMDAFQQGQIIAQNLMAKDVAIEGEIVKNAENMAGAPSRLRKLRAETSSSETKAYVDDRSADAHVTTANANAQRNVADANVATGTVGSRIEQQGAAARSATANADVSVATVPTRIEDAQTNTQVNTATAPDRITQQRNASRLSGVTANIAEQTEPNKITDAQNATRTGTANADVTVATAPNRITDANNATRAGAANADVTVATAPDKITSSRIGLRQQEATAKNAELQGFYKSLELLNNGQVEEAKAVAAATGHPLPDAVINDAQTRGIITAIAKRAQELYPNKPLQQQTFIEAKMKELAAQRQNGQMPTNRVEATYTMPDGAPPPSEDEQRSYYDWRDGTGPDPNDPTKMVPGRWRMDRYGGEEVFTPNVSSGNPGGRGGAGNQSVFQLKLNAYKAVYPGDEAGALAYAQGKKTLTDADLTKSALALAGREIANNTMLKFRNQAEQTKAVNTRAAEIFQQLKTGFTPPAAPGTTAPGTTAPPPPGAPAVPSAGAPAGVLLPAPRNPAERVLNQTYRADDGRKVKWLGNGWQVVP